MDFGIQGGPLQWFFEIPPVSRLYLLGALTTTTLASLNILSPYTFYLNWNDIIHGEVWRLVTNFLFFGEHFTLDFVFHVFFLVRYCRLLEEGEFRTSTADFVFFIIFGAALMIAVTPFLSLIFLGSSLVFMMVYVWGRKNSHIQMSLLGIITFRAPYLPWVLLCTSMLLNHNMTMTADLLGMGAGHIYYFLAFVYPKVADIRGWRIRRVIFTPVWLKVLCREFGDEDVHERHVPVSNAFPGLDGMGIPPASTDEPLLAGQDIEPTVTEEELNAGAEEELRT